MQHQPIGHPAPNQNDGVSAAAEPAESLSGSQSHSPRSGSASSHMRKPRDFSLLFGAIGCLVGASSGAFLTWLAWDGIQKSFANKGVGFNADVDGSGTVDIGGSGNVEGAKFDADASVENIFIDTGLFGEIEINTGGADTNGAGLVGEATIEDATISGTGSFENLDGDLGGDASLDIPTVPIQVVVTAATIFLAVIGYAGWLAGKVMHGNSMSVYNNQMTAQRFDATANKINLQNARPA